MTFATPTDAPSGWYPDPAGERAWRVWTGDRWSEVTRPYGEAPAATGAVAELELERAIRRVVGLGVVGVVGGLALLVGVLAHWPKTAHPAPYWFAVVASDLALALLVVGSVASAFAVKALYGRWHAAAFVPGVNLFVASALASRRLGRFSPWRLCSEIALLIVFASSLHQDPWLALIPVLVAYVESTWFAALVRQLHGPAEGERRLVR